MTRTLFKDKLFLVFVALLAITLASWGLILVANINSSVPGAALLLMAFVKVQLIVSHYMEASETPPLVRYAFDAWVWLVGLMCVALYFL